MIIHIPLPKKTNINSREYERVYLRIEWDIWKPWGSGGKRANGQLAIYRKSIRFILDIGWSIGKTEYSIINDEI